MKDNNAPDTPVDGSGDNKPTTSDNNDVWDKEREADIYKNPTQLWKFLGTRDFGAASKRIKSHPKEAFVWITKRNSPSKSNNNNTEKVSRSKISKNRRQNESLRRMGSTLPSILTLASYAIDDDFSMRRLPIHLACILLQNANDVKDIEPIIIQLAEAYPDGCARPDHESKLPIHEALLRNADVSVIAVLLTAKPDTLHARDKFGRTPLDIVRSKISDRTARYKERVGKELKRGVEFWETVRKDATNLAGSPGRISLPSVLRCWANAAEKFDGDTGNIKSPYSIEAIEVTVESYRSLLRDYGSNRHVEPHLLTPNSDVTGSMMPDFVASTVPPRSSPIALPPPPPQPQAPAKKLNIPVVVQKKKPPPSNPKNTSDNLPIQNKNERVEEIRDTPAFVPTEQKQTMNSAADSEENARRDMMLNEAFKANSILTDALREVSLEREAYHRRIETMEKQLEWALNRIDVLEGLDTSDNRNESQSSGLPTNNIEEIIMRKENDKRSDSYSLESLRSNQNGSGDRSGESNMDKSRRGSVVGFLESQVSQLQTEKDELTEENSDFQILVERLSLIIDVLQKSLGADILDGMKLSDPVKDDQGVPTSNLKDIKHEKLEKALQCKVAAAQNPRRNKMKRELDSLSSLDEYKSEHFPETSVLADTDRSNKMIEAKVELKALIEALESNSRFATERFLASRVRVLEYALNDALEAKDNAAACYAKEIDLLRKQLGELNAWKYQYICEQKKNRANATPAFSKGRFGGLERTTAKRSVSEGSHTDADPAPDKGADGVLNFRPLEDGEESLIGSWSAPQRNIARMDTLERDGIISEAFDIYNDALTGEGSVQEPPPPVLENDTWIFR